jgi:1,4-alpha-glucan branching enzyme
MKKLLAIFLLIVLFTEVYTQNAVVGTGFSAGWGGGSCPTTSNLNFNFLSPSLGSSFGGVLNASGAGNQYFRLGIDWSGTIQQRTITIGLDEKVSPNTEYRLTSTCTTSGAMYYDVPNVNYRYVFKTKDAGTAPKDTFIFFEVEGAVRSVNSVTQSPLSNNVGANQSVEITANTNGDLNIGQSIFLRYTNDNWVNSTILPMTSNGSTHSATIPGFGAGNSLQYYVLTSSPHVTLNASNVDFYTFNANTNNGQNFSYTVKRVTVSPTLPNENDVVTITFDASNSPLQGATKVYLHSGVSSTSTSLTSFNHTVGNWGQDDNIGLMTNSIGNIWTINISPNLRTFYNVPSEKDLFGLNFLFRNETGTLQEDNSGTNYYNAIDPGNYFTITAPLTSPYFAAVNSNTLISAESNIPAPDSWTLDEIDPITNVFISNITSASSDISFSYQINVVDTTLRKFRLTADYGTTSKEKTTAIKGYQNVALEPRPMGVKPGINYDPNDPTKATLVLHCPTYTRFLKGAGNNNNPSTNNTQAKNIIYVIGDFNDWTPSEAYKMKRDRDGWDGSTDADGDDDRGDYWWITLEGLNPGQEYVFQYLIDGSIRVADPYSHKISDPEDFQISPETYPGLISYRPQAVDRASVLQTNRLTFSWTAPEFTKPSPNNLNIYEMHFRDFTEEGTFMAAVDKLDYIKELGINAIHVLPVSEFEGNSSWGYNPNFYFAADKAYGTENDLKYFIDECHKREIQVFNDMVLNHAFYSNVMAKMYWNSTMNRPADDSPFFNPTHKMVRNQAGWWGADWNHESEHVQNMVDSILGYWLKEFNFDGFRFDFTKGFGQTPPNAFPIGDDWASAKNQDRIDLLKRMVDRMWAVYPGSVAIFEHLANLEEDRILANHSPLNEPDQGVLMWSGVGHHNDLKGFILGYNQDNTNIFNSGVYDTPDRDFEKPRWMSYGESHDEQRLGYELMQYYNGPKTTANMIDRLKIAYAFNLLLPGPRMLWQFGELGYEVDINFNGRTGEKPVRWHYYEDDKRRELYRLISRIFTIRNNHNIYANTPNYGNIGLGSGNINQPRIMKFSTQVDEHVIVVANLDPNNAHDVVPQFPVTGTWHRYNGAVDGATYEITASNQNSTYLLAPSEVLLFTNFPIVPCNMVINSETDGEGSLRNAIACSAPDEVITFDESIFEINLSQPLEINKNIQIDGTGVSMPTINGSNLLDTYILKINPNYTLHLKNINIVTNNSSNSIINEGNLIIDNVQILKN